MLSRSFGPALDSREGDVIVTAVVENSVGAGSRTVGEALEAGVQPGSVVCVDASGGPVAGWLVVDTVGVYGTEDRQCAVVAVENCSVLTSGSVSEVRVIGGPVPTGDSIPAWAPVVASGAWAAARLRGERDGLREERDRARAAVAASEVRLEKIVDAAHEYADEHSLCEQFDVFMLSQNLRPRSRGWVCEVNVTVQVRIPVTAYSADAASETITKAEAIDAVAALRPDFLAEAVEDFDVIDVEED